MPPGGVNICDHRELLSFEEIIRFVRLVKSSFGLSKVHLTGGEPLVRRGVTDLVAMLAAEGVTDLALTTNGQCLATQAGDLKRAGLGRVNVSLDSLDERTFSALTRGGKLGHTLDGIDAALREGLAPVKLNTVVLRGHNDAEVTQMVLWAISHDCQIRFLELMPIGCAKGTFKDLFVPESETISRLKQTLRLKALLPAPADISQSSRNFEATDRYGHTGIVGFITPQTRPFCQGCRRLRLSSTGRLVTCLAHGDGPDVRSLLRQGRELAGQELQQVMARELAAKRNRTEFSTLRPMAQVGG